MSYKRTTSQYLALELFHVLHINYLYYDYHTQSWMGAKPHSSAKGEVDERLILNSASMMLSGIDKQRINTLLTAEAKLPSRRDDDLTPKGFALLQLIQDWSTLSQNHTLRVFNPDLGAFRAVPQCLSSKPQKSD